MTVYAVEDQNTYFPTRWRTETGWTKNCEVKLLKFLTLQDEFGKKSLIVLFEFNSDLQLTAFRKKLFWKISGLLTVLPGVKFKYYRPD